MSRPLRIQYPNAWYHIMNRGRSRTKIFNTPEDYLAFIELLKEASFLWKVKIAAYCLMSNHYHLLLHIANTGGKPITLYAPYQRHLHAIFQQIIQKRWAVIPRTL